MTGWLKNYAPQHFMISFELAAFVEGIDWINGKLPITPHARDPIRKSTKKNTATAKPAPL